MTDLTALLANPEDITDEQLASLPTKGLSKDDWLALEPSEREAIVTEPDSGDEVIDDDETPAPAPTPAPAAAAPAPDAAPAPAAAAPAPVAEPEPQDPKTFVYVPAVPDTAALVDAKKANAAALDAIDVRLIEVEAKLEAGDISTVEALKASRTIEKERRALDDQRLDIARKESEAAIQAHNARATMQQRWDHTIDTFQTANADLYENETVGERAKQLFKRFAGAIADEEAKAGRDHSFAWFAKEAHSATKALLHPELAKLAPPAPAPPPPPPPKPNRAPDLSAVPTTLRSTPGADHPAPAGEFAEIDGLNGKKLMAAIEAMTPTQRERYERRA